MLRKEELKEADSVEVEVNNLIDEYEEIKNIYFKDISEILDIERIEFKNCFFENVKLQESRLIGCEFSNCYLKNVDISGVNFSESIFVNTILDACKLEGTVQK